MNENERRDIEDVILRMLGEVLEREPADVRQELEGRGSHMPIDSLDAVEIIVQLEDHYGVQLDDRELAAAMRSVGGLAQHIAEVRARHHERRQGA